MKIIIPGVATVGSSALPIMQFKELDRYRYHDWLKHLPKRERKRRKETGLTRERQAGEHTTNENSEQEKYT